MVTKVKKYANFGLFVKFFIIKISSSLSVSSIENHCGQKSVRPEAAIKGGQIFHKVAQKVVITVFSSKAMLLEKSQEYFGNFGTKICHQELSSKSANVVTLPRIQSFFNLFNFGFFHLVKGGATKQLTGHVMHS